jgi:ParB-like chromosome segregation protein Spo0J
VRGFLIDDYQIEKLVAIVEPVCPPKYAELMPEDSLAAHREEPKVIPKTTRTREGAKYRVLPPLDSETYSGLRAKIAFDRVQVPVVKDEHGHILDGFARAHLARELGYDLPSVLVRGLGEQEKRSQVRALNLARRHLDYAAKRQVIAHHLRENPRRSNRRIARSLPTG